MPNGKVEQLEVFELLHWAHSADALINKIY
jgi:hypothetical protein